MTEAVRDPEELLDDQCEDKTHPLIEKREKKQRSCMYE